ncbi:hypothetical protein [Fontivita pretiosa]|uniref:hypothetical protein n=1 Tax=Fontivita pretiosa TaxID=2989684 RepID=UPI003D180D47
MNQYLVTTEPLREGNNISVEATVCSSFWLLCAFGLSHTTIELGQLANRLHQVTVRSGSAVVAELEFTVQPGWRGDETAGYAALTHRYSAWWLPIEAVLPAREKGEERVRRMPESVVSEETIARASDSGAQDDEQWKVLDGCAVG